MMSTRSQQTPSTFNLSSFSFIDAAKALISLRSSTVTKAPEVLQTYNRTKTQTVLDNTSQGKFWSLWTNWYHAFLTEAEDEFPSSSISDLRSIATSRWVTFTSKNLRCSESDVRSWLRKANQKALLAACA
jgi:hypothetical protein